MNGTDSLIAISKRYEIPIGTIKKRSAQRKWSEKRRKYKQDTIEQVSDKLHSRKVNQTLKDIERVCKAAGRLIDKANRAIVQLDKQIYIASDEMKLSTKESTGADGEEIVESVKKRKLKTARMDVLIDTKRMSEISKTLLNIKEILTGEDGSAEDAENSGIIFIEEMTKLDERNEDENDMDAAAPAGGNDVEG